MHNATCVEVPAVTLAMCATGDVEGFVCSSSGNTNFEADEPKLYRSLDHV